MFPFSVLSLYSRREDSQISNSSQHHPYGRPIFILAKFHFSDLDNLVLAIAEYAQIFERDGHSAEPSAANAASRAGPASPFRKLAEWPYALWPGSVALSLGNGFEVFQQGRCAAMGGCSRFSPRRMIASFLHEGQQLRRLCPLPSPMMILCAPGSRG